jgi:NAD-dependent deacetylase
LLSALPIAVFGSIALPVILLVIVAMAVGPQGRAPALIGLLVALEIALLAAVYLCGRYTRWMLAAVRARGANAPWQAASKPDDQLRVREVTMEISPQNLQAIDRIVEFLGSSHSLLFITGAGISADSGLPTYRGIGGLYNVNTTEEGMPIEEALSGETMRSRPELTWKYLAQIGRAAFAAKFNRGHEVIAEMEARFDRVCTLTQNVDGFHRQAGSKNVIDIHGDMHDLLCTACSFRERVNAFDEASLPPQCPECETILRPDVVLFGEMLPAEKVERLYHEVARGFDLVFTIGTTSVFPYIAQPVWIAARSGKPTVEINPGQSEVSELVDVKLPMGAAQALDAIWGRYRAR